MITFLNPIYYNVLLKTTGNHSVNVITFGPAQSDHINPLLLYNNFHLTLFLYSADPGFA